MSTKENTKSGKMPDENGCEDLIRELKAICGVYAKDVKMIATNTDGADGKNLTLLGKKGSDATFQKVMTLMDKVTRIKELCKEPKAVLVKSDTTEAIDEPVADNIPKIKNIQDFALLKSDQA